MASILNPPHAPSKLDARLEEELGKATGRIRFNDLLAGGLALVVLTLAFATVAILVDRWLELSDWVRQFMLAVYLLAMVLVGYTFVVRPLRQAVNPRFAARKVEATIPESKNAVINWVDLHNKEMPAGVRAAVGARAVEGVADADVNKAVESRRVIWLAAAAGLLLAVLASLFIIFKPSPFLSLVSRTFNPFTVTKIASRTVLTIVEPQGGDVTVTSGDPVTIRVYVDGTVPEPENADRLRLRVRYNQAIAQYDETPLEPGGSAREWVLRVPQSVVQNGFWYTVAGGDAETVEYRVTVRSRPLFKEYEARYVYPAYTRLKPDMAREAALRAYPGTEVTLTAKANRRVKRGWMQIDGQPESITGQVVGEAMDTLQFKLTIQHPGSYHLGFTSTEDERSDPSPTFPIKVESDRAPLIQITSPTQPEISLPPDGLLSVDGTLVDPDFGLTAARLRVRLVDENGKELTDYTPKRYRDGKSFRRESDGTHPTKMDYKDSVALSSLKPVNSQSVELKAGMVLQYWLEADDNRIPLPNTGKSVIQRVRISAPAPEPQKQKQGQQKRADDEQQHQEQQDQQLQTEKRDPPEQLHQPEKANSDSKEGQKENEEKKPGSGTEKTKESNSEESKGQEKPGSEQDGTGEAKGQEKPGSKKDGAGEKSNQRKGTEEQPTGQQNQSQTEPETASQPRESNQDPMGDKPPKQGGTNQNTKSAPQESDTRPKTDPNKVERQAQDVQSAIDQQNRQPGDSRNREPDQAKPSEAPAEPKPAGKPPSESQSEQKTGQPTDPQGQPMGQPSAESKPEGDLKQPGQSDSKPVPKPSEGSPRQPDKSSEATGDNPKHPPIAGNVPAEERPQPKQPKEPSPGEKQSGDMKPTDSSKGRGQEKPEPNQPKSGQPAGENKPKPEMNRGKERPQAADGSGEGQPKSEERPAEAKGSKPTEPAASKQPPTDTEPNQSPMADAKPQPSTEDPRQSPSGAKPEGAKPQPGESATDPKTPPTTGQERPREKGTEKSAQPGSAGQGEKKVDQKEIEQAVEDLASGNPEKQKAARDKLDKMIGKEAREKAVHDAKQLAEDLQSSDQKTRQTAEQKLKDLVKQTEQNAGQGKQGKPLSEAEKQKLKELAKDLTSEDQEKREAAENEFDKAIGQDKRMQLQQAAKDSQSGDLQQQAEARKKFEDLMKSDTPGDQGQQPSPEEMQKWAEKAKDLNSPDKGEREAAEKEFDDKFGKEAREQIQEAMKDPKKAEEFKKKFGEVAKNFNKDWRPGGGAGKGQEGSLHKDDPRNRLRSAELQLKTFEENRNNKELQNKLGYTPEEYEQFLKSYQQRVEQMREEVAKPDKPETAPPPTGPAPLQVGEGTGNRAVQTRPDGTTTGGSGPGTAPAGYSDAQRKFAEEVLKLRKGQDKK